MSVCFFQSCVAPIPKPAWGPGSCPQLCEQWGQMLLGAEHTASVSVPCLIPCSGWCGTRDKTFKSIQALEKV